MHSNHLPVAFMLTFKDDTYLYLKCFCVNLVLLTQQHTSVEIATYCSTGELCTLHTYSSLMCFVWV